jgi:riboflavin kinase / FMN adenylyltransferase
LRVCHFPDDQPPPEWRQPIVALGNFDGLHRGHTRIIERVSRQARDRGTTGLVLTFDPHPSRIVRPDKAPPLLMTMTQRLEGLARAGLDGVAVVRFTAELSQWEPEEFVRRVLVEWLRVAEVWVGGNFLFGRDRTGNFSLLRALGGRYAFAVEKIDPVRYKDFVVSSTRIRRLITEGRVDEAGALLGHLYVIDGLVTHGDGRGRTLGVPTANLITENELLPPYGVYATIIRLGAGMRPSVTSVGVRPTIGEGLAPTIEAHVLDGDYDLYDTTVRLFFVQRMRPELAFPDLEKLRAQMDIDCRQARDLFRRISL